MVVSAWHYDWMMTNDFGKHYASMYTGSMRGKGALMFAVMGYVIATQVPEGGESERMVVEMNPEVVAFLLGEELGEVVGTIEELCKPDKRSRSKEEEGRRLVKLGEFLYWVVNGRKYREWNREERRREQNREAKRRERSKKKPQRQMRQGSNERAVIAAEESGDTRLADHLLNETLPVRKRPAPVVLPGEVDERF